jgi:hypothetical protein
MRAMQAAAEQTRKQIMDRFGDEARMHVDGIRSRSGEDLNELRRVADADVAGIREWSKAEIARIKAETDERIAARRTELERQVDGHGALVDREVEKFQAQVSAFEQQMDGFFARLQQVADPSTFAAVAQGMPEPPQIELLGQNARAEALAEAPLSAPAASTGTAWEAPRPSDSEPQASSAAPAWTGSAPSSSSPAASSDTGPSSAHPDSVWSGGPTPATISDWSGGSTSPIPASPEGWSDDPANSSPSADGWSNASTPATGSEWGSPTSASPESEWRPAPAPRISNEWGNPSAPATGNEWGSTSTPVRDDWGSGAGASSAPAGTQGWGAQSPSETTPPAESTPAASTSTSQGPAQPRDGDPIVYGAPAPLVAEALTGSAPGSSGGAPASSAPADAQAATDDEYTFSADARLAALGITRREPSGTAAQAAAPSMPPAAPAEAPAPASESATTGSVGSQASESGPGSMPGQDFNTNQPSSSESPAARLAGLVPSSELPANGRTPAAPVPTHVIVTGLLSVASIASFKRHLSRIPGVQGVGVSSGPDGEFIFKTTHDPGVALATVIPTLPGFGAEVVKSGEGTIQVAAHDPEADA